MNTTKKEVAKKLTEAVKLAVKMRLSYADFKVFSYKRRLVGWTAIGEMKLANKISIVSKRVADHSAKTFSQFLNMGDKYVKKYTKAKTIAAEIDEWNKKTNQFVAEKRKQKQMA